MTGLEIIAALELIRRGLKSVNGIAEELPEFLEVVENVSQKIFDEDDEQQAEKVIQEETEKVIKKRKITRRMPGREHYNRR